MIRNFLFWFCLPWALFFGFVAVMYLYRHPEKLVLLLPLVLLLGFAIRAEYVKAMAKADAMLANVGKPTRARATEDEPGGTRPPFNSRGPGQFTSFAFRYGLPPGTLKRRALPAPPKALSPPSDDG